jgi:hypothetical protein
MLVTLVFLVDVRKQQIRICGVLPYDRHLLDALVTLGLFYGGVDLRLYRARVRRGLPKPLLSVYLDLPAEVAVARARSVGDMLGEHAIHLSSRAMKQTLIRSSTFVGWMVDARRTGSPRW